MLGLTVGTPEPSGSNQDSSHGREDSGREFLHDLEPRGKWLGRLWGVLWLAIHPNPRPGCPVPVCGNCRQGLLSGAAVRTCSCDAADSLYVLLTPQVFAEIFDPVIKARHNGYDPRTMKHHTDLDASKVGLK